MTIHIGELADWHTGSMYGLWPEHFDGSAGMYELNVGQRYLLDNWRGIAHEVPKLDILLLNGDEIDGVQPKDKARYLCEVDPQYQARAAVQLLESWRKRLLPGGEVYMTQGTAYHMGEGAKWSEYIAKEMGAVPMEKNHYAWDWLLLDVGGKRLDVAHHQSHAVVYRATIQEREMNWSEERTRPADLIIRSHNHHYGWLEKERDGRIQMYLSTPPWQMQSRWCRVNPNPNAKFSPQLGMIVITISRGEIDKRRFLFEHPALRKVEYVQSKAA